MITEKICKGFPGISALISALKRAWRAWKAYNKAAKAVNTVVFHTSCEEWIQEICKHSQLSYEGAYRIYIVVTEETDLYKQEQIHITEFVMDMANRGHTADMIIIYLQQIDRELNREASEKLSMHH